MYPRQELEIKMGICGDTRFQNHGQTRRGCTPLNSFSYAVAFAQYLRTRSCASHLILSRSVSTPTPTPTADFDPAPASAAC